MSMCTNYINTCCIHCMKINLLHNWFIFILYLQFNSNMAEYLYGIIHNTCRFHTPVGNILHQMMSTSSVSKLHMLPLVWQTAEYLLCSLPTTNRKMMDQGNYNSTVLFMILDDYPHNTCIFYHILRKWFIES